MRYPAKFEKAKEGGFVVTFRDIPEAITQGDTEEEAREMAADALLTAMDFYFDDKRPVPLPSKARRGEYLIDLAPSVAAKIFLLNEMVTQHVTPSALARRLGTSPQNFNKVINLKHPTKIDAIDGAMRKLGKRIEVCVS
jgi:antitoxin HicB